MTEQLPVDPELEAGYNLRLGIPDFDGLIARLAAQSAAFREGADSLLDQAYDTGPKDKLDVFRCGQPDAPLFVFIHGGYWQRGDKSIYSFVAQPFVESGADVILVGYELCPDASMEGMADKHRKALAWIWRNAESLGVSADRINVSGHSAGGHLTAMMLATDWPAFSDGLPKDLIKSGIPISGLYQLDPLRKTTISHVLGLTDDNTPRLSPHFHQPTSEAPILVTLGGAETAAFHWQTDAFVEEWRKHAPTVAYHSEPDVDHFGVVERLAQSDSAIFRKVRDWLK